MDAAHEAFTEAMEKEVLDAVGHSITNSPAAGKGGVEMKIVDRSVFDHVPARLTANKAVELLRKLQRGLKQWSAMLNQRQYKQSFALWRQLRRELNKGIKPALWRQWRKPDNDPHQLLLSRRPAAAQIAADAIAELLGQEAQGIEAVFL